MKAKLLLKKGRFWGSPIYSEHKNYNNFIFSYIILYKNRVLSSLLWTKNFFENFEDFGYPIYYEL